MSPKKAGTIKKMVLPIRPDTKAANKLLEKINKLPKTYPPIDLTNESSKTPNKTLEKENIKSPLQRRLRGRGQTQSNTITKWLSKRDVKNETNKEPLSKKIREKNSLKKSEINVKKDKSQLQQPKKDTLKPNNKKRKNKSVEECSSLDTSSNYKTKRSSNVCDLFDKFGGSPKKSSKTTFVRTDSSESCGDLPTFKKKPPRKKKDNESFKKYGVLLPSLNDILEEQKNFEQYKKQVETAGNLEEPSLELPFSLKKLNKPIEKIEKGKVLDCKHLTLDEITEAFNNNLGFLSDIFHGKVHSDRHNRYHKYDNKKYDLTTKDLSYNTSMIVFTFDQKDHMVSLMQKHFDPDDKMSAYFFKVLLPELCLKIFMETQDMTKRRALSYLDTRPIDDKD